MLAVLFVARLFLYLLLKIGVNINAGKPLSAPMVTLFDKLNLTKKGEPEAKKRGQGQNRAQPQSDY